MTEKTKIIVLVVAQTLLITIEQVAEAIWGKSTAIDLKTSSLILFNLFLYILFGFFTKNIKRLFTYSMIVSLVNIIFVASNLYFTPDKYQKALPTFGNSTYIFILFGFIYMLIIAIVSIGLGMILSYLFKVIFKKRTDKF